MNDITNLINNLSLEPKSAFDLSDLNNSLQFLDTDCKLRFDGDISQLRGICMFTENHSFIEIYKDNNNFLYIKNDLLDECMLYSQRDPAYPVYYRDEDGTKCDGYFIKKGIFKRLRSY
jgi:hypothetical protein